MVLRTLQMLSAERQVALQTGYLPVDSKRRVTQHKISNCKMFQSWIKTLCPLFWSLAFKEI